MSRSDYTSRVVDNPVLRRAAGRRICLNPRWWLARCQKVSFEERTVSRKFMLTCMQPEQKTRTKVGAEVRTECWFKAAV